MRENVPYDDGDLQCKDYRDHSKFTGLNQWNSECDG
jgi:hypothetical protein